MSAVTSEAVLFFEDASVSKCMLYTDFEAILDRMVGMPGFSGEEVRGAYALVNDRLQVVALVLFLIEFDDNGMADVSWNVPLRHLAEHGDPGPDMGAGPIRLACRSQCPVAWHQDQLWDPTMKPGNNDFVKIRDTLAERGRKLGLYVDDEALRTDSARKAGAASGKGGSGGEEESIPVVKPEKASASDDQERQRQARLVKELRLRIKTMENKQKEETAQLRYAHQQKEEILSTQLEKVLMQFRTMKSQNAALKEQNESLKAQVDSLNSSLEEQARQDTDQSSEIEILTEQYRAALEQRLEEERARLTEEMHTREMEVLKRDERIAGLEQEVNEARSEGVRMANSGAEKLLEKLQQLGLNFIAYHPGAGHLQVNASEISDYMQNPLAFAARKCLVTEEQYRAWLQHYENPVCQVDVGGQSCGKRVIRVDEPNQFKPGVSDRNSNRCPHCRSDSAIDNVLKFR